VGAIGGNKSIITEGLHYYMDPGNKDAYPGSGTNVDAVSGPVPAGTLGASNVFSSDNGCIFNFDGASDYLQVASNGSTAGFNVNSYTICVWSKPTNTGQTQYDVLFSYDYTSHAPPYYSIHFKAYPTNSSTTSFRGKLILQYNSGGIYSGGGVSYLAGGDTSTYVSTSWNMYSVTFTNNGSSTTIVLYKNGTQLSTKTATQSPTTFYNQEVWLGKANFATGQYDGGYGPLMFYQKVLTQAEITQNYNALKYRFI
jgi:hypothetical protein